MNFKDNPCLQCKQIYGDARMNVRLIDLATPGNFENFILDECYEMETNKVPYSLFCYDFYHNNSVPIYKMMVENTSEDDLCSTLQVCWETSNFYKYNVNQFVVKILQKE